ncbi:hypothetical protein [Burkholderia gladioli]|uniref:hypothetical protein n=1 Tax=Burkholderia gladioli TaxID=28095 RepID=UPI0016420F7E|nr:hypothetical protein [Burkholderia gladioli]
MISEGNGLGILREIERNWGNPTRFPLIILGWTANIGADAACIGPVLRRPTGGASSISVKFFVNHGNPGRKAIMVIHCRVAESIFAVIRMNNQYGDFATALKSVPIVLSGAQVSFLSQ